jgi:hypothetical protein
MHQENCLKFLKFLFDHFADDSNFVKKHLFAQDEFGKNFSFYYLNFQSTNQTNINSIQIQKLQEFVDLNGFEKLFLHSKKISLSQNSFNSEETQKIDFLDILGLNSIKELFIRENQNFLQIQDRDLIENYYRNVLNYFDGKTSPDLETSSFEQLKLEAFRQLSIEYNFHGFLRPHKKPIMLNQILLDLEILRETSYGFSLVNNRVVEVFGFTRFHEALTETDGFNGAFVLPENVEIESLVRFFCLAGVVFASNKNHQKIEIEKLKKIYRFKLDLVKKSILARNPNGPKIESAGLEKPLIIEFIDFLKVQFGVKFIQNILTLKNSDGFTLWSHSISYSNISSLDDLKFDTFLEDILIRLCGNEVDFLILKKLALSFIFEKTDLENMDQKLLSEKYPVLFELEILTKLDDNNEVKFSDPCFLNYFALEGFYSYLIKNYENEETAKLCLEFLSEKEKLSEFCWLIEKFYQEKLIEEKITLHFSAKVGQENENLFFLLLDILLNQLKIEKESTIAENLFFKQDWDYKRTFLHDFCLYGLNWSEKSFEKLFKRLKEFKKYFPENKFREFLMIGDHSNWTFLFWLMNLNFFEISLNFLISEFSNDFVKELLLIKDSSGNSLNGIKNSITVFGQALNLFNHNFDKKFVKKFLMQKNKWDKNFLSCRNDIYSKPENSNDLLKLLDLIFSIFGADLVLFSDLFFSKSDLNETFFDELIGRYKEKELFLFTDWIKKNLGDNFLKYN